MRPHLPPKVSLLPSTRMFVELLELQLGITYPNMTMEDSHEQRRESLMKLVVGLIIVLSQQYDGNGRSCSRLLDEWLLFGEAELPSLAACTISARFTMNRDEEFSTEHKIQLLLDETDMLVEHIDVTDDKEPCILNPPSMPLPISILVLNARGALNPRFINQFKEKTVAYHPNIVIVTETRVSSSSTLSTRASLTYDSSLLIKPAVFFGGIWLLWNSRRIHLHDTVTSKRSFVTRFDLLSLEY
ncbi:hypothetical protein COLO4_24948 [Corchorus olitorius]|uniref:Uncharacterized protein n=1 Tax=Corchorus olitorius TaxID=93759 RepID=A0A1R3I5Z1_9ROSI|nr:hypothetical protein COLO4_24948 [Corchorus olitorius]